ncbi:TIR domain-containing protein [Microbulbifer sp. 2304DJ12-6]|uniref:TIR domain-containing protein n=1 Tax=Microbulbifer sp. 2304DJ12-6 TaxID=3233340 RepID=UPI0039B0FDA4
MSNTKEFEIALSFAGEDREYVDQVANLLRDSGVKVFYDLFEEANLWGKNLYDYLTEIYRNKALYTIMFISDNYSEKLWANHERQAMQARAFQENQEYILPVRFDETPIPGILPTTGYIDISSKSPEEFVKIIHRKLINSGLTIPSERVRKSLFSTQSIPKINTRKSFVNILSSLGEPIQGASVVAIADNGTTKSASSDENGVAELTISTRRNYQLLVAHPKFPGAIIQSWDSGEDINISIAATECTGSVICMSTGYIPGLQGRLNPILDTGNRTYLYADNIAINGGLKQPTTFATNTPFKLEDCDGVVMEVKVLHIQGRTSLLQFVHPAYDS